MLGESQEMLGQLVERYLTDNYGLEVRQTALAQQSWPAALWQAFADKLGILGLPFPEAQNGLGLGPLDALVVMQALGRGLAAEPYLSSVIGLGALVNALPDDAAAALAPLVGVVIAGTARVGIAITEGSGELGTGDRRLASAEGSDRLTGSVGLVSAAGSATHILTSAATDAGEIVLILLERSAAGMIGRDIPTIDGNTALALDFDVTLADGAVISRQAAELTERMHDAMLAALTAEIVGIIDALTEITVDFAKQRTQFGKPIGQFQAIQHRLADMYVEGELARSMALLAAIKLDARETERRAAIAAAKARVGLAGRKVGESAIQIHGGIGTTDELIVGHYFKRLLAIEALFGGTHGQVERYAHYRAKLDAPLSVV
jgi:alkylation response protein AidB-like acyl-CoA dehydrogenase